jgi:hypothetical protein
VVSRRTHKRIAVLTLAALVFSACGGGAGGSGGGASSGGGGDAPSGAVATGLQTATDGWSFPNFPSSAYPNVNFDETDLVSMFGSDDASGGIGLAWNNYSAGDGSFCCTSSNGINRSMAFEMYVR